MIILRKKKTKMQNLIRNKNFKKNLCMLGLMVGLGVTLSACDALKEKKDAPLKGDRISILELQKKLEPTNSTQAKAAFTAPPAWPNMFWPQSGGYPNHALQHPALPSALDIAWSVDTDQSRGRRSPLLPAPVVVDGRIYVLTTRGVVRAYSIEDGHQDWESIVDSEVYDSKKETLINGGLSIAGGKIYATTGARALHILNPATGEDQGKIMLPTPARSAPTIIDGRLFVVTIDNRLLCYDIKTLKLLWDYTGLAEMTGLLGMISPAADSHIVVPAFSSGEIYALQVANGSVAWSENVAPATQYGGKTVLSDIGGSPVIDQDLVFAGSYGGRISAVSARTGDRVWYRDIGLAAAPWVVGNALFVLTPDYELISLVRDTGDIRWISPLPRYENEEKRKNPIEWTAPIFAGGRLMIASTKGELWNLNAADGTVLEKTELKHGGAHTTPIVAGQTLYILSDDGTLVAYR
jgi:outer membrane protein assembly factor BamB